jgi:hypothetical protein
MVCCYIRADEGGPLTLLVGVRGEGRKAGAVTMRSGLDDVYSSPHLDLVWLVMCGWSFVASKLWRGRPIFFG